jgi:hypothetical protein
VDPSEIIAVIPVLTAGTYHLQFITRFGAGRLLKTPKTTTFAKLLTAA